MRLDLNLFMYFALKCAGSLLVPQEQQDYKDGIIFAMQQNLGLWTIAFKKLTALTCSGSLLLPEMQ